MRPKLYSPHPSRGEKRAARTGIPRSQTPGAFCLLPPPTLLVLQTSAHRSAGYSRDFDNMQCLHSAYARADGHAGRPTY